MSELNESSKISDNILIEELGNKMNTVSQDNEQQENVYSILFFLTFER